MKRKERELIEKFKDSIFLGKTTEEILSIMKSANDKELRSIAQEMVLISDLKDIERVCYNKRTNTREIKKITATEQALVVLKRASDEALRSLAEDVSSYYYNINVQLEVIKGFRILKDIIENALFLTKTDKERLVKQMPSNLTAPKKNEKT